MSAVSVISARIGLFVRTPVRFGGGVLLRAGMSIMIHAQGRVPGFGVRGGGAAVCGAPGGPLADLAQSAGGVLSLRVIVAAPLRRA